MTAVSQNARRIAGIAVFACLWSTVSVAAAAQDEKPDEFHVGDRIALTVEGPKTVSDTVVVRDGLVLRLAGLGDIPLAGVKRSDAQAYLTQQIGKFIRDPIVHATPLIRVAVLGQVGRPGFYTMPSDVLVTDALMQAGAPTGNADISGTVVKRGTEEVVGSKEVASAISSGMTLDQLHIAPGDQIVVPEKSASSFDTVLKVLGVGVPLITLLVYLTARH